MYGKRRERARASEHPRRLVKRGLERKSIRGNPLSRRMFSRRVPRRRHRRRRACATLTYIDLSPSLSSTPTPWHPRSRRVSSRTFSFSLVAVAGFAVASRPLRVRRKGIDLCLGEMMISIALFALCLDCSAGGSNGVNLESTLRREKWRRLSFSCDISSC